VRYLKNKEYYRRQWLRRQHNSRKHINRRLRIRWQWGMYDWVRSHPALYYEDRSNHRIERRNGWWRSIRVPHRIPATLPLNIKHEGQFDIKILWSFWRCTQSRGQLSYLIFGSAYLDHSISFHQSKFVTVTTITTDTTAGEMASSCVTALTSIICALVFRVHSFTI